MQPVAEVALVDFGIELVGTSQAQLPQREEAVGATAQVFIDAGRDVAQWQQLA